VELFTASIRENVTLFRDSIPDAAVQDALEALGLGDWLRALPDGLDTQVAPRGGTLSSGQAQLVAFARALLKNPGLVILDEATARVDPHTERLLATATERLLSGRTAVIIAHRLESLHAVDTVAVLEAGAVLERGAFAELAANPESRLSSLIRQGRGRERAQ
jgi:ABC-type multidrug transport system fused ATPase/permease subunit